MKQLQMSLQMLVRCRHLGLNLNLFVLVYLQVESLKAFPGLWHFTEIRLHLQLLDANLCCTQAKSVNPMTLDKTADMNARVISHS